MSTHSPVSWSGHFLEGRQLERVYDTKNLTETRERGREGERKREREREGGREGGRERSIATSNRNKFHHSLKVPSSGCGIEEGELELLVWTNNEHLKKTNTSQRSCRHIPTSGKQRVPPDC